MHADVTEVIAEAWLHKGSGVRIKRLAGRAQHFVDDGRNFGMLMVESCWLSDLALQPFLPALLAFAAGIEPAAAGAFALQKITAPRRSRRGPGRFGLSQNRRAHWLNPS